MSYRFNGGDGAVTCDVCNVIIDEDLSFLDYEEIYGKKGDICWRCSGKNKKEEDKDKKDVLNDGWRN